MLVSIFFTIYFILAESHWLEFRENFFIFHFLYFIVNIFKKNFKEKNNLNIKILNLNIK